LLRWWYGTGVLVPVREDIGFHEVCWQYSEADIRRVASYLTSEEAAQFLEVSIATLERWIQADQIPAMKNPLSMELDNPAMFDKQELTAWRNARLTRGEAAKLLGLSSCAMTEWIRDKKIFPMEVMVNGRQWYSRQDLEELARKHHTNTQR
jgi:predicted DNA-binding transcriptional regulator AlpA